jgi:hypothetical protein
MSYLPRGKNADYWEGRRAEAARLEALETARLARRVARGAALDAAEMARFIGRDNAIKQRIVQRNPWFFAAMDTEELGAASSRQLAERELKELGIEVGDNDPVALLDAHHAGRAFVRARGTRDLNPNDVLGGIIGGWPAAERLKGVERPSSAQDGGETYLDKYLET